MRRPCTARRPMQAALADLREAEARIERIRVDQSAKAEALRAIQERFYAAGAEVTRIEQSIQHAREMRAASARRPGAGARRRCSELAGVIERDRGQLAGAGAGARDGRARPRCRARGGTRRGAPSSSAASRRSATWQQVSDAARAGGRLGTARDAGRARPHRATRQSAAPPAAAARASGIGALGARAAAAGRGAGDAGGAGGSRARCRPEGRRRSRAASCGACRRPAIRSASRPRRSRRCARAGSSRSGLKVSTEALQQAALGKASGKITEWLKAQSLDQNPRVAQQLRVEHGWERAVETVLGSYLEAVCVEGMDAVADLLGGFDGGHLVVVSGGGEGAAAADRDASLKAKVLGADYLGSVLASVFTAETLARGAARAAPSRLPANRWSRATGSGSARTGCACRAIRSRTPASSSARRRCARCARR